MDDDRIAVDRYCTLNGLRFHYQQWGDPSAPPLVLLHGVLGSAVVYDAIAARLANTRFVLVLDQRGHGQSDRASDYSWPRWVEDLSAFWELLGLGNVDLVGHSMGAHNAARAWSIWVATAAVPRRASSSDRSETHAPYAPSVETGGSMPLTMPRVMATRPAGAEPGEIVVNPLLVRCS
jgi:hypothetical protein